MLTGPLAPRSQPPPSCIRRAHNHWAVTAASAHTAVRTHTRTHARTHQQPAPRKAADNQGTHACTRTRSRARHAGTQAAKKVETVSVHTMRNARQPTRTRTETAAPQCLIALCRTTSFTHTRNHGRFCACTVPKVRHTSVVTCKKKSVCSGSVHAGRRLRAQLPPCRRRHPRTHTSAHHMRTHTRTHTHTHTHTHSAHGNWRPTPARQREHRRWLAHGRVVIARLPDGRDGTGTADPEQRQRAMRAAASPPPTVPPRTAAKRPEAWWWGRPQPMLCRPGKAVQQKHVPTDARQLFKARARLSTPATRGTHRGECAG
jgi:hypothetical protein